MTFAQSIATLEIRKAVDLNGQEINPSLEYTPGTIRCVVYLQMSNHVLIRATPSHPPPFQCRIEARTAIARGLLEKRNLNLQMEIETM